VFYISGYMQGTLLSTGNNISLIPQYASAYVRNYLRGEILIAGRDVLTGAKILNDGAD